MLEALAVDLHAAPDATVEVKDTKVAATGAIGVDLSVNLGLNGLLPAAFDLVDVQNLVNIEHVL